MFDAKKINQPYQFIDSLYHRLSGYLTDLEEIDPASPHETRGFVQAVLNWMKAYKDSPVSGTDTEVKVSRHIKVSYYDLSHNKDLKCIWDHKPICTVTMLYRNGYLGIGYAFCHPKKDKFDRKYGIELSTRRAEEMIEKKSCPVNELSSEQRRNIDSWIDLDHMPYWIKNSKIGETVRQQILVDVEFLLEDFFFELTRVLAKQDLDIKGDVTSLD